MSHVRIGLEVLNDKPNGGFNVGDLIMGGRILSVFRTTKEFAETDELDLFDKLQEAKNEVNRSVSRAIEDATEQMQNADRFTNENTDEMFAQVLEFGIKGVGSKIVHKDKTYEIIKITSEGFFVQCGEIKGPMTLRTIIRGVNNGTVLIQQTENQKVYSVIEAYSENEEDTIAVFSSQEKADTFISNRQKTGFTLHVKEWIVDGKEVKK